MRSKLILSLAVVVMAGLLATAPAVAADPFGFFGGIIGGGNAGGGVVSLIGWALHDVGVESVDVYADGVAVGRASYGRSSGGVAAAYPGYPDAANARWAYRLDTTRFVNGMHTLSVLVTAVTGESAWLQDMQVEIFNAIQSLRPFGEIESPLPQTELFGVCDSYDPMRRYTVVSGYAVDAGIGPTDSGVKWVQLLINGSLLLDTKIDCQYLPSLGGLTNCYGLRHGASARWYPSLIDPPHAGFRFVLDIGELVETGFVQGHHRLSIRAGDMGDQVALIADIPVTFLCDDYLGNEGSFGHLGRPTDGNLYSAEMLVQGWALDWEGIDRIEVYLDGELVGTTEPSGNRPAVTAQYPGYPDSLKPGFSLLVDTTLFRDGEHTLLVVVVDEDAPEHETVLGQRRITFANP